MNLLPFHWLHIADTGAGVHLRKESPQIGNAMQPASPLRLTTANGVINSD